MQDLLLCSDLFIASQLRGSRPNLTAVSDREQLFALIDQNTSSVLLDLTCPACEIDSLVPEIRKKGGPQLQLIAFAPHVHVERLAAARQAGCDQVLSRSQVLK